jgi:hypothetical protein
LLTVMQVRNPRSYPRSRLSLSSTRGVSLEFPIRL